MSERVINKELTADGLKKCGVCLEVKPISEFKVKKDRGRLYHQYLCKECQRKRDEVYKLKVKNEQPEKYNRWVESRKIKDQEKRAQRIPKRTKVSEESRRANARIFQRIYYLKNKERKLLKDKIYGVRYRSEHKEELKKRNKEARDKRRDKHLYCEMFKRETLADDYIKKRINRCTGLRYKSITPDLIDNWRVQIKTIRLIGNLKQKKNENT